MQTTSLRLRTTGPQDTRALGAALAELLRPGDAVALSGELGAGKTCLVQGAVAGLGIEARVTSPTFVLVRLYEGGRLPVVHCDVYRLDQLRDVDDLGDEVLAPDVVTFIEWADAVVALLPDDRLEVDVQLGDDDASAPDRELVDDVAADGDLVGDTASDGERVLMITPHGVWSERATALVRVCAPWRDDRRGGDL